MSRHIDRLRAEQDLREFERGALCAAVTAQGDQQFLNELRGALMEQMGTVMQRREVASSKSDIEKLMAFANQGMRVNGNRRLERYAGIGQCALTNSSRMHEHAHASTSTLGTFTKQAQ